MFGKALAAAVLAAGAITASAATASAAPVTANDFGACMDYAVGEYNVEPWLAHDACDAGSFEECYWVLRRAYVPAQVAATACQLSFD
ncbi:hypothetical protein CU254_18150 [Amycolatopsis sp. AA4]|uniref:hypothetical protein n=1 Tax=Actinomycetes TaxID=1760 RepID=UPI0001B56045|nr:MULTISPECIES: hypothetical protein [Actinomycetes]ATY12175.1 hypothetical protein CU254_18150 [Amycolatopsis sp. AA4]EFL07897.1 predicted protein [Streptomyces sp. AA4]